MGTPRKEEKGMKKTITIEWAIHDTRNTNPGYRTGISKLTVKAKNYAELMNAAISFTAHLPGWELDSNNIDLKEYKDEKCCCYYYRTEISKILKIEDAE